MSLRRLISRARLTVLGLNSGTSADGLDLAVVQVGRGREKILMRGGGAVRFPRPLRAAILATADSRTVEPAELVRLDNYLGQVMGRAAAGFLKTLSRRGIAVDLIGSHGQTVRHVPEPVRMGGMAVRGTLQIGSPDQVAAATGCVTVGDFRQAEVALGGEGAPITTGAMHWLFASPREPRLIVNIGGIANYFYLPPTASGEAPTARDCGPGNSLSDALMARSFGRQFDRDGRMARRGRIDPRLLAALMESLGFARRRRSTGRELFGADLADEVVRLGRRRRLRPEDLLATAGELTALGIARALHRLPASDPPPRRVYLMGGGRHNQFMVERLGEHLPGWSVEAIDQLGVDGDLVEAAAYAVMAAACVRGEPLSGARTFGVARAIAGRIVQPPAG
ncbi:MAG TPA: anhydro-N-acetylmuramic acid kinase [candidate division Zixibacteria bacterium]|nr:anhydro-N-acetylmuramic acid kinase [candidate division Zixibacteria bacterium]MDD4917784.1 anhydro-N-acetylmuramic acid kinase [candidate division Zixibacteria bacterium]MDM7971885.1 anhydro-N-acetylmuramic acid kinase [candidate division Zixibacteria bacterium]HPM36837.1 anhydro-N-acetylmuramic acid kinase [candidate division Zixibacteria bacterium]